MERKVEQIVELVRLLEEEELQQLKIALAQIESGTNASEPNLYNYTPHSRYSEIQTWSDTDSIHREKHTTEYHEFLELIQYPTRTKNMTFLPGELHKAIVEFIARIKKEVVEKPKPTRIAGLGKGLIHMTDDFDAPLDDFMGYMK